MHGRLRLAHKSDDHGPTGQDFPGFDPASFEAYVIRDPQALMMNVARAMENLGRAASEWLGPRERGETQTDAFSGPIGDFVKTMSVLTEYWMSDPKRMLEAQTLLVFAPTHSINEGMKQAMDWYVDSLAGTSK